MRELIRANNERNKKERADHEKALRWELANDPAGGVVPQTPEYDDEDLLLGEPLAGRNEKKKPMPTMKATKSVKEKPAKEEAVQKLWSMNWPQDYSSSPEVEMGAAKKAAAAEQLKKAAAAKTAAAEKLKKAAAEKKAATLKLKKAAESQKKKPAAVSEARRQPLIDL